MCQHFWPETFGINSICEHFVERGCDVDVLCGIPNYPEGRFYPGYSYRRNRRQVHNGIRIRRSFEVPRGSNTNLRVFANYMSFPVSSLLHVPRLLFRRYDRVFIYQLSPVMMAIAGILVGTFRGLPTTMYVLDLWPENLYSVLDVRSSALRRFARAVSHWHYRRADRLIALSETMRDELQSITGLPSSRFLILPQASDPIYESDIEDDELRARFSDAFNVVFAGNISPAQDFPTLISAARMLRNEGLERINWIIVGDGMSRGDVEKQVESAGMSDRFFFEGFKPASEIPKYHTVADALYAGLAQSELLGATIPAKVMSYMASGRPVVVAMDGEPQKLVRSAGCGFASGAGDVAALADNIRSLYSMSAEQRREMGLLGRRYHSANLSQDKLLDRLHTFVMAAAD
ncbi:MAG: glycosyltransferase family 4 protein [Acidimicrobiales bacterium]